MIRKRIISYGIDLILVTIITSFIFTLFTIGTNPEEYLESYENYMKTTNNYINDEATEEDLINAEYDMMKSSNSLMIIKVGTTIFYFAIIPFLMNGQTIGKKLTKIKVVSNNNKPLHPGLMFLRGLIVSLVLIDIINIVSLMYASPSSWYDITYITSALTYTTYIVLIEFAIFRKDKRSLHDLISNTKVIESKQL